MSTEIERSLRTNSRIKSGLGNVNACTKESQSMPAADTVSNQVPSMPFVIENTYTFVPPAVFLILSNKSLLK